MPRMTPGGGIYSKYLLKEITQITQRKGIYSKKCARYAPSLFNELTSFLTMTGFNDPRNLSSSVNSANSSLEANSVRLHCCHERLATVDCEGPALSVCLHFCWVDETSPSESP